MQVTSSDISALAKRINEYSSQTGLLQQSQMILKIMIESSDGYDINLKNINAPSVFILKHLEKILNN